MGCLSVVDLTTQSLLCFNYNFTLKLDWGSWVVDIWSPPLACYNFMLSHLYLTFASAKYR